MASRPEVPKEECVRAQILAAVGLLALERLSASSRRPNSFVMNWTASMEVVNKTAKHLHRRFGGAVSFDDLVGQGQLGLVEAWASFDPDRGIPFEGYAYPRIRGRMYDALRMVFNEPKHDHTPTEYSDPSSVRPVEQYEVRQSVSRLPSEDQELLSAYYGLGSPWESGSAYAAAHGLHRSTASVRHRRALDKMRRLMGVSGRPPSFG